MPVGRGAKRRHVDFVALQQGCYLRLVAGAARRLHLLQMAEAVGFMDAVAATPAIWVIWR
jgi:hypothetical protein